MAASTGGTRRLLTLPVDRRDQVFSALVDHFAERGVQRTSMQALADSAGMSRPALYQYFTNKFDVFVAVASWDFARQAGVIEAIAAQDADVETRLVGMLQVVLERYDPDGVGSVFRAELIDDVLVGAGREWDAFQQRVSAAIVGVLTGGVPDLDEQRARVAAAVLITSTKGVGVESIRPASVLLGVPALVDFVLQGVGVRSAAADTIG
jgi:AcrR family transcriptional regulator